jgi:3-dehydroquinate synthase
MKELAPPLEVRSQSGAYTVQFLDVGDPRSWSGLGTHVVCDAYFVPRATDAGVTTIAIEATEQGKTLEAMAPVVLDLREKGVNRDAHLVAIGGGVVQDVVTFAASIFMRGVPWTYVPTTLMAMADSCIGGKSSINVGTFKNLVGNFHPPRTVVIDTSFLKTLSAAEIASGLSEAVKICFCKGKDAFATYLALYEKEDRIPLLRHVLATKIWFIEIDEFDKKERRLLNFGHTWGHALEASTDYAIPHGLAVAVGMIAAIELSGVASEELFAHARELLRSAFAQSPLPPLDRSRFLKTFRADKKHKTDSYRLIVPQGDAVAEISVPKDEATEAKVFAALERAIGRIW